jgi:hypothetical protein
MRKTILLLVAVAVALLVVGAAAALAQEAAGPGDLRGAFLRSNQQIQCTGIPCVGTGRSDLIFERIGNGKRDRILLKGGNDQVKANTYRRDKDVIKGHSGSDLIYVDDGDTRDRIFGGRGGDKCYVDARSEAISGCGRVIVDR